MQKLYLKNLDCVNCATKLEKALQDTPGVDYASIDIATTGLFIDAEDIRAVRETIKRVEPGIEILDADEYEDQEESGDNWTRLFPLLIAGSLYLLGLIFYQWLSSTPFRIGEILVFGIAYGVSGWSVIRNAARNIIRGQVFDENFLMTVATIGAILIGEMPEAAGVMIFYMIGETLQEMSVQRSRQSIKALVQARPDRAAVLRNGKTVIIHPQSVKVGETFLVKPGEKVPLDGKILQGTSAIDSSPLTGESRPKSVRPGDRVYAGSINKQGLLTLVAERPYADSSIARIVELTENAVNRKAQTERFITRFARIYSPIVVFSAIGVALIPPLIFGANLNEWVYRALVVLVISCPCALVISIPLGYFGGIGGASKRGILVKGSNFLDVLASVKTLVFDKTGTLTRGVFKVTQINPRNGFSKEEIIAFAAQAEAGSAHPIAQSIRDAYYEQVDYQTHQSVEIAGHGVKAIVEGREIIVGNDPLLHKEEILHDQDACNVLGTIVHVAVDGKYAGYIVISDELKPDAVDAIRRLRASGVPRLVMLTGDKRDTAAEISEQLGLDDYEAELLPEEKTSALETIIRRDNPHGKIGFVGDGINDAPALALADVGIAMGALGSEAAIEAADVVIMTDSPGKIVEAIQISRKTKAIVLQNIAFALMIKALFIILGISGHATMWQAVFGDMGVALIAIFNATRVLGLNRKGAESKV